MIKELYIRKGRLYNINEILPLIRARSHNKYNHSAERIMLEGDLVNVRSSRLITFRKSGIVCVCCGIVGAYFVKERHRVINGCRDIELFHLNLYGLDDNWEEVLMTSDHIVPHCRHSGRHNNRQTMCYRCNHAKGNREISNKDLAKELGLMK